MTIHPRKACQQRAEAATAIGNAGLLYECVFVLTFVSFVESTDLRSGRGWRRWIIQRSQPLYLRAPAAAVEATCRSDSYAARAVRFLPAFFCTTILLTGHHFYFSSKFDTTINQVAVAARATIAALRPSSSARRGRNARGRPHDAWPGIGGPPIWCGRGGGVGRVGGPPLPGQGLVASVRAVLLRG